MFEWNGSGDKINVTATFNGGSSGGKWTEATGSNQSHGHSWTGTKNTHNHTFTGTASTFSLLNPYKVAYCFIRIS